MVSRAEPSIIPTSPNLRWPDGRHVAVVFNVAYEAWSEGVTSGVGPMGNVLAGGVFDPNADSYGRYNANVGTRRLLMLLDEAGVKANVFASGVLADEDPEQVRAFAADGHEIVGHGYTQDLLTPLLSPEENEDSITRSTEALTKALGRRPLGWISPRATSGEATQRLLAKHGYQWQCDVIDRDMPYIQKFPEGDLLAIPLAPEFNDLSHAMRFGRTPQEFVEMFQHALRHLIAAKDDPVIVDILVHGHCFGRPSNAWAVKEIADYCARRDAIWVTTRGRIAEHVLGSL
jgi:peptidoglycan/xylan/chitin deacetylase (PgdA/CDA1 family)